MSALAPSPETRPTLLVRIRDPRDGVSWREFVTLYAPVVYAYCRRKHLQDADAADVTQEVLTEVLHSIGRFQYRPERGRFRDWLGTVARRRLARFLRRRHGKGEPAGTLEGAADDALAEPPDAVWTEECCDRVLRFALARIRADFSRSTWQAFEGVWLDGRPAAGVAGELGLSVEAVYVAKCRVLKRLEAEVRVLAEDLPLAPAETPSAPKTETA